MSLTISKFVKVEKFPSINRPSPPRRGDSFSGFIRSEKCSIAMRPLTESFGSLSTSSAHARLALLSLVLGTRPKPNEVGRDVRTASPWPGPVFGWLKRRISMSVHVRYLCCLVAAIGRPSHALRIEPSASRFPKSQIVLRNSSQCVRECELAKMRGCVRVVEVVALTRRDQKQRPEK